MRVCRVCQEEKELTSNNFYINRKGHTGGFDTRCRECCLKDRKIRRTKEENKRNNKKHYFGITVEEYDTYFVDASCGICGSKDRLVLDHCHTTMKVRGVLCSECNSGIGLLKDSVQLCRRAVLWLEH